MSSPASGRQSKKYGKKPDRRPRDTTSQSQDPTTGSSGSSWNSAAGSAGEKEDVRYYEKRLRDEETARREREEYARALQGPPAPPEHRPTPDLRAFDQMYYGRQQPTTVPATYYTIQSGYTAAPSGYAQTLDLDYVDAPSNDRRSDPPRSSGKSSRQHHGSHRR